MVLTLKQKKLLIYLLNENDYKKSEYFAKKLEVSVRTLYKYITVLEEYLKHSSITLDKKAGVGIKLVLTREEKLRLINSLNLGTRYIDKLSTEKRIMNIALKLLYADNYTSMQDFADKYLVSKTSIANDIEKIEGVFAKFKLSIIKCHKGIKVQGCEKNIRQAINYYIKLFTKEDMSKEDIKNGGIRLHLVTYNQLLNFFSKDLIKYCEECIIKLEDSLKLTLSDVQYVNILTHLLILIKRVNMGKKTMFSQQNIKSIKPLRAYDLAKSILDSVETKYNISIPEQEIIYLATYILGCNSKDIDLNYEEHELNNHIKQCIDQVCTITSNILSINLDKDEILKNGLLLHIIPMLNRCRYDITLDNPILSNIREQYFSMFSITSLLCVILEDEFNITINEDEIGYLTLHFAAAVERCLLTQPKKVLIVCYGGIGTSQFLANRIRNSVSNIKIMDVIPSGKLNDLNTKDIDFIISTVNLNYSKKPVIIISPLLNEQDIAKLNEYIISINGEKTICDIPDKNALNNILDVDLIFTCNSFKNRNETLDFLCSKMLEKNYITKEYFPSVLNREKIGSTYIGNFIAIPHGDEKYINEEKIVICSLKQPVLWGTEKARLIFLICIKTQNKSKFKEVLKSLYNLLDNPECIKKIMNCENPDKIYTTIKYFNEN